MRFHKEGIQIFSNDLFKGNENEKFSIELEAELIAPFIFLYEKITGHTPMGFVFLKMLEFRHWEICFEADDETG